MSAYGQSNGPRWHVDLAALYQSFIATAVRAFTRGRKRAARGPVDYDAGVRVANSRSPSPRRQFIPARQRGGLDSPQGGQSTSGAG